MHNAIDRMKENILSLGGWGSQKKCNISRPVVLSKPTERPYLHGRLTFLADSITGVPPWHTQQFGCFWGGLGVRKKQDRHIYT